MITLQYTSMSSDIRAYISVLVASLMLGGRRAPERGAAAGREADDVGATGDHARHGDGVVAGGVMNVKPLAGTFSGYR